MIPEIRNLDYPQKLSRLRLQSTERRYDRYSVIYTRICISVLVPIIGISIRREDLSQNGTMLKVPITKDMSYIRRNSFLIRAPELFNCLPAYIRDLSIWQETFKKRLDEFLSLILDKPWIGEGSRSFHSNTLDNVIRQWKWTIDVLPRYCSNTLVVSGGRATPLVI